MGSGDKGCHKCSVLYSWDAALIVLILNLCETSLSNPVHVTQRPQQAS